MDTDSETGISNLNENQKNLELTDKPKKKSGKKKKNSKKQENELKNSDSHITSQNKADEATSSEEKKEGEIVTSVGTDSCLNSKDDLVEQREDTDIELNETMSQTKSPKAKKRKKKKSKTMEACDPLGNILVTSMQNEPEDFIENNYGIDGRESTSNLLSKRERESSATGEENYSQNRGKTKEKVTDENNEVNEDFLAEGACAVKSKKQKGKKKKISSADSESVECSLDHSNREDVENYDGNAGQLIEKTEDEKGESNQDALGAVSEGVSDGGGRQKRKRKKKKICESVTNKDSESVQGLLSHSNKEGVENCDGTADGAIASKDLACKIENFATEGKNDQNAENTKKKKKDKKVEVIQDALGAEDVCMVEVKTKKKKKKKSSSDNADGDIANNDLAIKIDDSATEWENVQNVENANKKKKDKKSEVDQDALGAESTSKVEVKTKKKKKKDSSDQKTDKMEEKDDVSLLKNNEEPEIDRENIEPSSSVLIDNNVAQGVSSAETVDVPRCSCGGQNTKKLIVFDLNGILADIVKGPVGQYVPDGRVSCRSVFRRPFVFSFLDFCFKRFDIGIWSSRHIGLDYMINNVLRYNARNLLFCFGQDVCITTKFKTQENASKPLFLKDIRRVWERFGTCFTCGKRKYDETNTLLVDDSPDKALCNPPYTGIFPFPYQYTHHEDSALGPEGELRKYLERLADAPNVQKFVEENPFGQTPITETHKSWEFYSKVIEAQSQSSTTLL